MQYGCIVFAARVQHTCVACAGVHVCSMYAVQQGSRYICSMYAVYMPNMCSKVADIYAVCMHYVCNIVHACILHTSCACIWHVSIFVHAAHVKTSY